MGVTGLLQQLKDIQEKTTLTKYKGKTLAVDTYGWLHRGLVLCAQDLCTDAPTRGYITSVMKKVDMVRHFGVEPLMIFDGSPLPTKEGTQLERRMKREKARAAAQQFLRKGDRKSAWKEFMKAAEVTPEMAKSVMVELDRNHVRYIVAPYEADPQMVYLEKIGAVDGILSEDSDLLVFGCKRLITKLNDYGECIEICRDNLHMVPRMFLHTYTHAQWRLVAILSGCDYTKGIPGVGLKTAFNVVLKLQDLDRIIASLKAEKKTIPSEFMDEALKADLAFQYQKVFDPSTLSLTTLCEIAEDTDLDMLMLELCCGHRLDAHIHTGICLGRLNPFSHKPLVSREQNLLVTRSQSVRIERLSQRVSTSTVQTSQSFSSSKPIESYFKPANPADVSESAFARPNNTLKRTCDRPQQLSPSSKKLRRFQNTAGSASGTPTVIKSKFFDSHPATTPPISVLLAFPKPSDADFGIFTGESEVPEDSSSPIKADNDAHNDGSLTDDDGDAGLSSSVHNFMVHSVTCMQLQTSASTKIGSDDDEGYENELDESPIKTEKIGLSWRRKFAMGSQTGYLAPATTQPYSIRTTEAVKVCVAETQILDNKASYECLESSLVPHTLEEGHPFEKPTIPDDVPQLESLHQTYISESENECVLSPQRTSRPLPQQSSAVKLLRFAFTGR